MLWTDAKGALSVGTVLVLMKAKSAGNQVPGVLTDFRFGQISTLRRGTELLAVLISNVQSAGKIQPGSDSEKQ